MVAAEEAVGALGLRDGDSIVLRLRARPGRDSGRSGFPVLPEEAWALVPRAADAAVLAPMRLGPGAHRIGRARSCNDVVVEDAAASRRHASLVVFDGSGEEGNGALLRDDDSRHGTFLNGVRVERPTPVRAGDVVGVGSVELVVSRGEPAAGRVAGATSSDVAAEGRAAASPISRRCLRILRPPDLAPEPGTHLMVIPAEPEPGPAPHLEVTAWLVPLLMAAAIIGVGVGLPGAMGGVYMVVTAAFVLMSPLMVLGGHWEHRRRNRREHEAALEAWVGSVVERRKAATSHADAVRSRLEECYPCPDERSARLFEGDPRVGVRPAGALRLRVGTGPVAAGVEVVAGCPEPSERTAEAVAAATARAAVLDGAPVTVGAESTVIAVAGETSWRSSVAAALVLQFVTVVPAPDRRTWVVGSEQRRGEWEWIKWLPTEHDGHTAAERFVAEAAGLARLVQDLEATATRVSLVVVADPSVLDARTRHALLEGTWRETGEPAGSGDAAHGRIVVWLCDAADEAPPQTCTLLARSGATATMSERGARLELDRVDRVTHEDATRWARALAPMLDASEVGKGRGSIPPTVSLWAMLVDWAGVELPPDQPLLPTQLVEAVRAQGFGRSVPEGIGPLVAPIAVGRDGVVELDLRRDGPHVVVAGMTGAGKSELLQSLIVSLAAVHPPGRVRFLLVDFKGGAAFGRCEALPHTVDLLTDLDGDTERMLRLLRAELDRRMRLLARVGAKDLGEWEALAACGASTVEAAPNLVVVIDEFAEAVQQVEDFDRRIVDLARRGRSLGVHLVLATQRPAGVLSSEIAANVNQRIALRVATAADSHDVIGVADAARIPRHEVGRAVLRCGNEAAVQAQIAYGGGPAPVGDVDPYVTVGPFELGRADGDVERGAGADTELDALIGAIVELDIGVDAEHRVRDGDGAGFVPWLPALDPDLHRDDAPPAAEASQSPGNAEPVWLGRLDDLDAQRQPDWWWDPSTSGSVAVRGGHRANVEVIRRLVGLAAVGRSPEAVRVDVLDDHHGSLGVLANLAQVGTVVGADDEERFARVIDALGERCSSGPGGEVHLLVVADLGASTEYADRLDGGLRSSVLRRLLREGGHGSSLVIAGVDPASPAAVSAASGAALTLDSSSIPGRVVVDGTVAQLAAVADGDDAAAWGAFGHRDVLRFGRRAPATGVLPRLVRADDLCSGRTVDPWEAVLGLSDRTLAPARVDLADGNLLVLGPMRSGRTNALATIARTLASGEATGQAPRRTWWSPVAGLDRALSAVGLTAEVIGNPVEMLECGREVLADAERGIATVVFVDDATELDAAVDEFLEELADRTRTLPLRLVVAAESQPARSTYGGVVHRLRRERRGILLQPDIDLDGDLLGVRLSRRPRREMPVGRGEFVCRGRVELIQLALAC
ncbi:MAG: FtsK/SpoIIIE domain-containing protein [Microthrixaceae bacterium]